MSHIKKRVLFFNGSIYLPGEGGYKRTMFLVDLMKKMGYRVTLLTTDFNHYAKERRDIEKFRKEYPDYAHIQFIHRPVYKKNISFMRFISDKVWARKAVLWFKKHYNEFDVVFTGMPNAPLILSLKKYCEKYNIKIITDVRDLFPEALHVVIKNELFYRILTLPMTIKADKAYACADELIAVSEEYLNRALKTNKKSKNPAVVYLGFTMEKFDRGVQMYSDTIKKDDDEIWVTYAGTLGNSYDIKSLIYAAKEISDNREENIRFKILGQGPEEHSLKELVQNLNLSNVDFVGFVDYEVMAAYLHKSDMAVNALKKNAAQSVINKVADYYAAGIPMINGSMKPEMRDMVEKNKLGINYEAENVESLTNAINTIIDNKELKQLYGANAREFALKKFNREVSYLEIIKRIDEI